VSDFDIVILHRKMLAFNYFKQKAWNENSSI